MVGNKITDIDKAVIEALNYGRPPGVAYYDSEGNLKSPEQDFKEGGFIGDQAKLDLNNNNKIDKGDFDMMNKKKGMAMGGKVKAKGMAMGGKVKAKGMAMGGKIKSKGMAMGGKVKAKGMAMGGVATSKGAAMGGRGFGAARSLGKGTRIF